MVASDSSAKPGDSLALPAELMEPLGWTFEDGVARYTRVYVTPKGKRITAFAPIVDRMGQATAVLTVDYPVDIYLDRLHELDMTIWRSSLKPPRIGSGCRIGTGCGASKNGRRSLRQ